MHARRLDRVEQLLRRLARREVLGQHSRFDAIVIGQLAGQLAQGSLAATWGVDKVADFIRKMNALQPVLTPSPFPLAQQVAVHRKMVELDL